MASVSEQFPGVMIYDSGSVVTNPYSGNSIELTAEELSLYDYIKGAEMLGDYKAVEEGCFWFRLNNREAYYILLD